MMLLIDLSNGETRSTSPIDQMFFVEDLKSAGSSDGSDEEEIGKTGASVVLMI